MSEDIRSIEINFPVMIDLPLGWYHTLEVLVDMICKEYERRHPDRVMWVAGGGAKPIWSKRDVAFLGVATESEQEVGEPHYDESVLLLEISERADYGQRNQFRLHKENEDEC